jgi:hypothetical protein
MAALHTRTKSQEYHVPRFSSFRVHRRPAERARVPVRPRAACLPRARSTVCRFFHRRLCGGRQATCMALAGRATRRAPVRLCRRDCARALCDVRPAWASPHCVHGRTYSLMAGSAQSRAEQSRADAATELRYDCAGPSLDLQLYLQTVRLCLGSGQ